MRERKSHLLRRLLNVSPGVQVGGQLVQPVVDVEAALRGGAGAGGGAGGPEGGGGRLCPSGRGGR